MELKGGWTSDGRMLSIQVMTKELPGRPFPAYAVLFDVKANGEILWNTKDAKDFRASLLKQLWNEEEV